MKKQLEIQEVLELGPSDYTIMSSCSRIVIDGDNGGGKTRLAAEISRNIEADIVSLDEYLLGNGEVYWDQIDYDSLRAKIAGSRRPIIIEGVCALKILARIDVRYDYLIFIKRFNGFLGWEYGDYLTGKVKPPKSKLPQAILQYYTEFKPFAISDVVLNT